MESHAIAKRLLGAFALIASAQAAAQGVEEAFDVPISIEVPVHPTPVTGDDGKRYVVYNLFLWNWGVNDLNLKAVEIFDDERRTLLTRYDEKALSQLHRFNALIPQPARLRASELRRIPGGRTSVLYVGFTIDASGSVPTALRHRFRFETNPNVRLLREAPVEPDLSMVLDGLVVPVASEKPLVIGPPLRDGPWKCSGGIDNNSLHQHQTTLVVRAGKARIPERFAIDFQKVDAKGDILPNPFPDEIDNTMFYGYGEEVLAVADGVVSFVKDGIPENVPQASGEIKPAVPITRETVAGNHLAIDLGHHRYAFYAHLEPGSLRVKLGDKVRRGQVLGLVGNSGNAVGPHLHFHMCDQNALNGCEGLPFVFDAFQIVGHGSHTLQLPLKDRVVRFGKESSPSRAVLPTSPANTAKRRHFR